MNKKKITKYIYIGLFAALYLSVALVSGIHAVAFFSLANAPALGVMLANDVVAHIDSFPMEDNESGNEGMSVQRGIMMTFAAVIAMEENIFSTVVHQTAENSFNSELERLSPDIYTAAGDSGAFSFYYLAYRRGTEVVRRMGQTFAMLCSHDGDPIYQELGEAIYCWFKSFAENKINESGIN